jgi:Autographiviridae endonuclease VII
MQTKTCSKCRKEKPIAEFFKSGKYPSGKDKIRGDCKECSQKDTANWRVKNRSEYNNYVAMWRANNPEKQHATEIKRRYGMSAQEYAQMLKAQNYRCKICDKLHAPDRKKGRLFVDHCHASGRVRGLLCANCNSMIGHADDNVKTLEKAIIYLQS